MNSSKINIADFVNDEYLKRGFGSMNKNDFEVAIFYWLIENNSNCVGKSDFCISQYLKIPESKVKRLRYEAKLKYIEATDYNAQLKDAFTNIKVREGANAGKVCFVIQDKVLRQYIEDVLLTDGRFYDSSFNSNIVSLSAADFVFVLDKLILTDDEKSQLIQNVKNQVASGKEFPKTFAEVAKNLGLKIAKTIGEKALGTPAVNLFEIITDVIKEHYMQETEN